jgi:predicted amidophosphoribosyltransferase
MRVGLFELIFVALLVWLVVTITRNNKARTPATLCPKCEHPIAAAANFCSTCGTVIRSVNPSIACPSCGHLGAAGANFCRECGASVQAKVL